MTVVLAISSAVLALNGALEASAPEGLGSSFAMGAVVGALESAPSEPLFLMLNSGPNSVGATVHSDAYLEAIRIVFPVFDFPMR